MTLVASDIVLRTETVVDAPPEQVWDRLIDVSTWDTWNPTLFGVPAGSGPVQPGREIRMKLRLGGLVVPMRQQIQVVNRPRELRWRSKQMVPGAALDVIRSFLLEPLDGGRTRLVQTESMTGFLAKPTSRVIAKLVVKGYDDLGHALAGRVGGREG